MALIEFENVSKSFVHHGGRMLLRAHLRNLLAGKSSNERFHALTGVSFQVERSESLAFIGPNGAGKSTLLGILAGLSRPDEGRAIVNGRVAALLELGSGFHQDLTGAENIRLNASMLGLNRRQTAAAFDEIVAFSGIEDFIYEPLRTYSSGMIVRLAFSVAVNTDPDILLIDEVLVVGDQAFQAKCSDKIHDFRRRGKTLVFVSHALETVTEFCNRAIWLDHGRVVMTGTAIDVVEAYSGHPAKSAT